jgi:catechol 2,3-dioxygenase-like lactoylglutathione lyase family enzyme
MAIELRGSAPLFEVFDMAEAFAFYRGVLGFDVVSTNKEKDTDPADVDWAWLRKDDVDVMLNTAYDHGERPPQRDAKRAFGHGVCLYIGCPDVDAMYAYLRAHGVDAKPPVVAPYGMKQLYVRDPDGYNLCFQWPENP